MAKEILLYSGIYNFVAENIINAMEANKSTRVNMRVNSGGGDLQSSWGIAAKMQEHGNVHIQVDGMAMSSAFNLCMYAKSVECLDVTNFMAHRAAYSYGGDSAEEKAFLAKVNDDLRKQMEARIDSARLKAMKGVTIADIFDKEERIMVFFSAKEAEQLGIVSKVNKLTPQEVEAFNETFMRIAAEYTEPPKNQNQNFNTMNSLAELKEKYPAIYAQALAEGKATGIVEEKDRVGAAMVFAHIDLEGVRKIIESGKAMTQTQTAEFALKVTSESVLASLKKDAPAAVKGAEVKGEAVNAEVVDFENKLRAELGLDKKKAEEKRITLVTA